MNKIYYLMAGIAIVAGLILASSVNNSVADKPQDVKTYKVYAENRKYQDYQDGVAKVRVGAGRGMVVLNKFFPSTVEINAGEKVTWYNPAQVAEPHTVTFMKGAEYFAAPEVPYAVPSSTTFTPLDPSANAEPTVMPGQDGNNIVVVANARSYSPAVITEDGSVLNIGQTNYSDGNTTYEMDGNEKFVNSGWLWPEGQSPPGTQPLNSFTVTFKNAGTYDYVCIVHPWMAGQVIVK